MTAQLASTGIESGPKVAEEPGVNARQSLPKPEFPRWDLTAPYFSFFAGMILRLRADVKHIFPEFDLDTDE
jgi:hypothetical protein|tara:strand:+ start:199 stop:411 length:213 start_codon:yes stop_codon:yes gene_type:complete